MIVHDTISCIAYNMWEGKYSFMSKYCTGCMRQLVQSIIYELKGIDARSFDFNVDIMPFATQWS